MGFRQGHFTEIREVTPRGRGVTSHKRLRGIARGKAQPFRTSSGKAAQFSINLRYFTHANHKNQAFGYNASLRCRSLIIS